MENSILNILPIVLLFDLLIPFLLAPSYKGYNHLMQVMSVLGNDKAPLHGIYNIWLIILGIVLILNNFLIYKIVSRHSTLLAILLFIAILIYAIGGCVLSGLFSLGETKSLVTFISEKGENVYLTEKSYIPLTFFITVSVLLMLHLLKNIINVSRTLETEAFRQRKNGIATKTIPFFDTKMPSYLSLPYVKGTMASASLSKITSFNFCIRPDSWTAISMCLRTFRPDRALLPIQALALLSSGLRSTWRCHLHGGA